MLLGVFWDVLHTTSYPRDDWCACALHACVRAWLRACVHVCVRACVFVWVCVCVYVCVCIYIYTRWQNFYGYLKVLKIANFKESAGFMERTDPFVTLTLGRQRQLCKTSVKNNTGGSVAFDGVFLFFVFRRILTFPPFPPSAPTPPCATRSRDSCEYNICLFFIFPQGFGCFMRGGGDMVPPKMADKCGSDLDYGRMWHYIWRRLMTWERVTSRMDESRDIWMRFVICAWMIYVTYPGVIANLWHGRRYCWGCAWVMSHMKGSCYIWMCHYRGCFWGVWMWKSHVTYGCNIAGAAVRGVNQSCHIWRRRITYGCNMSESDVGGVNESCHTLRDHTIYRYIIAEGAVGGVDESCYIWKVGDICV